MKKNKLLFVSAVWVVLLSAILGFFLLTATDKETRESEAENRMLAAFPKLTAKSLSDASFMSGFETFLSDAFFMRNEITHFTERLTDTFSVLSDEDQAELAVKDMEDRLAAEGAAGDEGENAIEPEAQDEEEYDDVIISDTTSDDDLSELITPTLSYMWLDKVGGGQKILYEFPKDKLVTYADTLRRILDYMNEDGQIFFAQVPLSAISERWLTQPEYYCGWGSTAETVLSQLVQDEKRIHIFNAVEILEPHLAAGEELFYKTDHHWRAEGAYLVFREMMRAQNLPVTAFEEYEYKSIQSEPDSEGVRDTFNVLYPLLPANSMIITDRIRAEEIELMNYSSVTYRAFMNNTRTPWRRITTGVNNGRRALVICDSYGNAFTPYLLAYYDEVHMVDFRKDKFDKNLAGGSIGEMMKYYSIDDVYIITSRTNGLGTDNSSVYLRDYLLN